MKGAGITIAVGLLAGVATIVALSGPSSLEGEAIIIDGDTIRVQNKSVRLLGIDAPELGQLCTPYIGGNGPYDCGLKSRTELRDFVQSRTVKCKLHGKDVYSRHLGVCAVDGHDLAMFLISRGLAVTYGDGSYRYVSDERFAKAERAGVWSTFFDPPATWRNRRERAAH